jgi:hypothetical protein
MCSILKGSLLVCLLLTNVAINSHPDEYDITTECAHTLQKINEDTVQLPGIIYGFCRSLAQRNESTADKLCLMINTLGSDIDKLVECQYKPASWYLTTFLSLQPSEIEKLFKGRYEQSKDLAKTWKWFEKAVYKKHLIPKIEEYQRELVATDDKMLKEAGMYGDFRAIESIFYRLEHTTDTTLDIHE